MFVNFMLTKIMHLLKWGEYTQC